MNAAVSTRERTVPCHWCRTHTANNSAVCDAPTCQEREADYRKVRPCRCCGQPVQGPRRWCSTRCRNLEDGRQ